MALAKPRLSRVYFYALMFMLALLLCISAGIGGIAVHASDGGESPPTTPPVTPIVTAVPIVPISEEIVAVSSANNSMIVNTFSTFAYNESRPFGAFDLLVDATWLDDEMLRIDVVDITTGAVSSLAVRLSDFVTSKDAQNSRYIMVQAVDMDGNLSGIVQIINPFYNPAPPAVIVGGGQGGGISGGHIGGANNSDEGNGGDSADDSTTDISAVPSPGGLTPDGTGTVVDNVVTQNEIEFFTVYTEEGNVFFLVVDRNRNSDNVYLLNAVTEADLMALAEQSGNPITGGSGGNTDVSAVPTPPNLQPPAGGADGDGQPSTTQPDSGDGSDSDEVGADAPLRSGNNNLIFIAIILVAVGGVAYYFKIVKPKKSNAADDEDLWGDDAEDNWDGEDDYLNGGDLEDLHDDTGGGGDDE